MNRRNFIQSTAVGATALAGLPWLNTLAAESPNWPIGCFNRPWVKWSYDDTLDAIKTAGYTVTGLLTAQTGEAFSSAAATPEYLDKLKKRIADRGLTVNMTAIRLRLELSADDAIADLRKQIENAARLDIKFMLTFGVDQPAQYDKFYRVMADAGAETAKRGIKLVLKPHGGGSGASEEILRCIEKVAHENFKVWYDAGNIIYYTGKDPVKELEPIAKYVTGFCAKDCPAPRGEVMSQFGTGKVDFKAVFTKLKSAGFNGPIMVEGVKVAATTTETTANAKANREFLEKSLAEI